MRLATQCEYGSGWHYARPQPSIDLVMELRISLTMKIKAVCLLIVRKSAIHQFAPLRFRLILPLLGCRLTS